MFDITKVNVDGSEKFDKNWGDRFDLDEFIEMCEDGDLIDYDGFAGEILLNGNIIYNNNWFYPSDALFYSSFLLDLQEKVGKLEIVWYNK